MRILFIQGNDYAINLDQISDIDWTEAANEEITVSMASGNDFTVEGEDYQNFLLVTGIVPPTK